MASWRRKLPALPRSSLWRHEEWLCERLAAGPLPSRTLAELLERDRRRGLPLSQRTLNRARRTARVVAYRQDDRWFCRLPTLPPPLPDDVWILTVGWLSFGAARAARWWSPHANQAK